MQPVLDQKNSNIFDWKNSKQVLDLALPAMAENILQVLLGIVDTFFIAKLGTAAIAAVGATNLIINLYIAFFTALGVGTTALVARNIGAKKPAKAGLVTEQSLLLTIILGLLTGVISLVFSENILALLGVKAGVLRFALPYFRVVAVPSVFLAVMLVLSRALRGAGDTKTPLKITLLINLINVILDYILIFGLGNMQGLGISGAGLATTLARLIGVILLLVFLRSKKSPFPLSFKLKLTIKPVIVQNILKIGFPAALERMVMRIGQLVYSSMIIQISTAAYAAHNIAGSIESLSYMPGYGFAIAASTLVGQNLGANQPEKAQYLGRLSNCLGSILMVVIGIFFFILARPLGSLFTTDIEVLNQVVLVLRIIALVQPALATTLIITAALQGAGDTKFPMYSTLIGIWGIRVSGVYLLGIVCRLGLVGVWIAVAVDLLVRAILLFLRFRKGQWKEILQPVK